MKIWKKTAILISIALLAGAVHSGTGSLEVSAAPTTQQKIDAEERKKDKLEEQIDKTHNELDSLQGEQNSLQRVLNNLNSHLSTVVDNLESLEQQIRDKEQSIEETQAALDEAIATEEWQYNSMVTMVRCLYERPADDYLTAILTAGSLAEALNMADSVEKVISYSQRLMQEYQENRILIQEEEARLQREKIELENLKIEAEAEKSKVSGLISQTSKAISQYEDQIAEAERKAEEYEAELKKTEENLDTLNKQLAAEIAMSQAAANAAWRDISEVSFAEGDLYLLANLIYCEAGAEPYAGKLAVGAVVINRVLSSKYPDTVVGVIYQKKQFSPVGSGRLDLALAVDRANEDCYRAAQEAMSGATNVGSCLYFRTPIPGLTGISIGGHIFY